MKSGISKTIKNSTAIGPLPDLLPCGKEKNKPSLPGGIRKVVKCKS